MASGITGQIRWGWRLTAGYRFRILAGMGFGILSLMSGLLFVYLSKRIVDIAAGDVGGSLTLTAGLVVAVVFAGILAGQVSAWLSERARIQLGIHLQNSFVASQMRALWEETERWHTGDVQVRFQSDIQEVVQMLCVTFPSCCVTAIRLLAYWGFLWTIAPLLAALFVLLLPLLFCGRFYYQRMRRLNVEVKKEESRLGVVLQENLKYRLLVRALSVIRLREEKYLQVQEQVRGLRNRLLTFSSLTQFLLKSVFNGGYLFVFLWGIWQLHAGTVSFGTLTAFLQLVNRVQAPVLSLIAFIPSAIRYRTAAERVAEVFGSSREEDSREEGNCIRSHAPLRSLTVRSLAFGYGDCRLINGLTATLYPGEAVAIVGETGKGKTTLIRLMLALLNPHAGEMYFTYAGGRQESLSVHTRACFSYTPQQYSLFSGTIRENLLLAAPSAPESRLDEVLRIACADFVYTLPQGIDTPVGESGYGLSAGQAQRLSIARALLHDGQVWIFDEATSALDKETSERLVGNLLNAGRDKIMIFITHDPHLAAVCPQMIRID